MDDTLYDTIYVIALFEYKGLRSGLPPVSDFKSALQLEFYQFNFKYVCT